MTNVDACRRTVAELQQRLAWIDQQLEAIAAAERAGDAPASALAGAKLLVKLDKLHGRVEALVDTLDSLAGDLPDAAPNTASGAGGAPR